MISLELPRVINHSIYTQIILSNYQWLLSLFIYVMLLAIYTSFIHIQLSSFSYSEISFVWTCSLSRFLYCIYSMLTNFCFQNMANFFMPKERNSLTSMRSAVKLKRKRTVSLDPTKAFPIFPLTWEYIHQMVIHNNKIRNQCIELLNLTIYIF